MIKEIIRDRAAEKKPASRPHAGPCNTGNSAANLARKSSTAARPVRGQLTDERERQWQKAERIRTLYEGRGDVILVDPRDESALRPEKREGAVTTGEIVSRHLAQRECLGVYLVSQNSTCRFAAIDFDNKPDRPNPHIRDDVLAICNMLAEAGITPLVSTSISGRGFHISIFFSKPTSA